MSNIKPILECADISGSTISQFQGTKLYISTGDLATNKIDYSNLETITYDNRPSRASLSVNIDDVIFAKMKDTKKTLVIGNVERKHIYSTGFYALKAKKDVLDKSYLFSFINSDYFLIQKDENCSGATQKALNNTGLAKIKIPLPPLETQKKIADELDKITGHIEKRKSQIEKLDLLIKAKFVEMFGDDSFKRIALIDLSNKITDGTHQSPKFISYGIPFLLVSNIVNYKINYETKKFISVEEYRDLIKRTPIEIGDILLTTVGSYGNPAVVESETPFCFQRHIGYIKPKKELINSYYLKFFFLSPNGKEQIEYRVKGIAQKTLNITELKNMVVPLPPLDLQNKFAEFVEKVEKTKQDMQKALEVLELLYKQRMQEYFE